MFMINVLYPLFCILAGLVLDIDQDHWDTISDFGGWRYGDLIKLIEPMSE